MWGLNAEDELHHYFESMEEGKYICGVRQHARKVKLSSEPDHICPRCYQHYEKYVKPKLKPQMASSVLPSNVANATKNQDCPPETVPIAQTDENISRRSLSQTIGLDFEQERLHLVLETIAQQIGAKRSTLQGEKRDRLSIERKDFNAGVVTAWKYANEKEMLKVQESMQAAPYFGRIDFIEQGYNDTEIIYIGRGTLEDVSGNFLVYDWRAPICTMYYRFSPGQASFLAPKGYINGEMSLKRSYEIENGAIVKIYDASGKVEDGEEKAIDEMLTAMLQRNSAGKMRQIVQSIQEEQDKIIRATGDVVVVQGPAGSGKTIIALHRAAYLLYNMRLEREARQERYGDITAQRMLVFSPNNVFSDYISRVLPDLNEGQIQQVILENRLQSELRKFLPQNAQNAGFEIESKESQYEYVAGVADISDYMVRSAGAKFKTSPAMLSVVDAAMQTFEAEVTSQFENIYYDADWRTQSESERRVFYGADEMRRTFHSRHVGLSLFERLDSVFEEAVKRLVETRRSNKFLPTTVSYIEGERQRFEQKMRPYQKRNLIELYLRLWNEPFVLQGALHDLTDVQATMAAMPSDASNLLEATLTNGYWLGRAAQYTLLSFQAKRILHEDIVPLLLLSGEYFGYPAFRNIDHAVIDEAQDYSLVHYEYIKRCLPEKCKLTVVGDVHQATNPLLNLGNFDTLEQVFSERIKRLELTRSYRSSAEITELARCVPAIAPQIESVRQTGVKPRLVSVASTDQISNTVASIVKHMTLQGYASVAVVCKTRRESELMYKALSSVVNATLLTSETATFAQGIFVTSLLFAKGLEFDVVILPDVSKEIYGREAERNMLYTACTRALHELCLCYSGTLSPFLPPRESGLYALYEV